MVLEKKSKIGKSLQTDRRTDRQTTGDQKSSLKLSAQVNLKTMVLYRKIWNFDSQMKTTWLTTKNYETDL